MFMKFVLTVFVPFLFIGSPLYATEFLGKPSSAEGNTAIKKDHPFRSNNNLDQALLKIISESSKVQTEQDAIKIIKTAAEKDFKIAVRILSVIGGKRIESLTGIDGEGKFIELNKMASAGNKTALLVLGELFWMAEIKGLVKKGKAKAYIVEAEKQGLGEASVLLYQYLNIEENNPEKAFKVLYRAASTSKSRDAMFELAMYYRYVKKDRKNHIKWLLRAANRGHESAIKIMAEINKKIKNQKESQKEELIKAAKNGSEDAQVELDKLNGIFEIEKSEEYKLLEDAATAGEPAMQLEFAKYLYTHRKNRVLGRKWVEEAASKNYSDAFYRLALIYEDEDFNYKKSSELYKKAVEQNHVKAMNALGINYVKGLGVKKDIQKGLELYHRAANLGSISAAVSLGYRYSTGQDLPQNIEKGLYYYNLAAVTGHPKANNNLGYIYSTGQYVEKDIKKAYQFYKIAAENGNVSSQEVLGQMYLKGNEAVEKDLKESFKWYIKAVRHGKPVSLRRVGDAYYRGLGVKKDVNQAIKFYNKAANLNDPIAVGMLCSLYLYGEKSILERDILKAISYCKTGTNLGDNRSKYFYAWYMYRGKGGVVKNKEMAVQLYKESADNGNGFNKAVLDLSQMYIKGDYVERNPKKAMEMYKNLAHTGSASGLYQMGYHHYKGNYLSKDYAKAFDFLSKSAEKQNRKAMHYLGMLYKQGNGVEENKEQAFKWFKKAADKGVVASQSQVGYAFMKGIGVKKDLEKSFDYHLKCAEKDDTYCMDRVAEFYLKGLGTTVDKAKSKEWYTNSAKLGSKRAIKALQTSF